MFQRVGRGRHSEFLSHGYRLSRVYPDHIDIPVFEIPEEPEKPKPVSLVWSKEEFVKSGFMESELFARDRERKHLQKAMEERGKHAGGNPELVLRAIPASSSSSSSEGDSALNRGSSSSSEDRAAGAKILSRK